jgi:hypothetical protein
MLPKPLAWPVQRARELAASAAVTLSAARDTLPLSFSPRAQSDVDTLVSQLGSVLRTNAPLLPPDRDAYAFSAVASMGAYLGVVVGSEVEYLRATEGRSAEVRVHRIAGFYGAPAVGAGVRVSTASFSGHPGGERGERGAVAARLGIAMGAMGVSRMAIATLGPNGDRRGHDTGVTAGLGAGLPGGLELYVVEDRVHAQHTLTDAQAARLEDALAGGRAAK